MAIGLRALAQSGVLQPPLPLHICVILMYNNSRLDNGQDAFASTRRSEVTDVTNYFEIISIKDNLIHAKLKGAWSDRVMNQFSEEIQTRFEQAVLSLKGRRFILLADWSDGLILGPKAETHLARSMVIFKQNNGHKVVEVVPKALVRIELRQAAKLTREDNFRIVVSTMAEAWEVIEKLQKEISTLEDSSTADTD